MHYLDTHIVVTYSLSILRVNIMKLFEKQVKESKENDLNPVKREIFYIKKIIPFIFQLVPVEFSRNFVEIRCLF